MATLFAVAIESVCLLLGFDKRTTVKRGNIYGVIVGDKVQFPNFEYYASLTFVGDHIADPNPHMQTPRRYEALVLLQI